MRITFVQANQAWEDKSGNLNSYLNMLEEVEETDLILLPEMFNTGFSMQAVSLSEDMNGEAMQWLKTVAQKKNAAIYTSFICKQDGKFYNRGIFMNPDATFKIYDKRKCFGLAGEDQIYKAGDHEAIVEYRGWRIQLQICYDLRFPEIVRNRIDSNGRAAYDLLLYVANWPEKRRHHWKSLLIARAIENQCYVAGLNRVGQDGNNLAYTGDSMLVDALGGTQLVPSSNHVVKNFVMNLSELNEIRERLPFLKDIDT